MSGDLTVKWSGGERRFTPGTEVRIGRDPEGHIVLDNSNVSRLHVSVSHDGSGWILRDQGSFQGTFKDGLAVTELLLGSHQTLILGAPQVGERLEFSSGASDIRTTRPGPEAPSDGVDTVLPNRGRRPGGELRDDVFDGATVISGQTLRVECGGKTYEFMPGKRITIGRDPNADIVSVNPTVSRTHAVIFHDPQGWKIEDLKSSAGTFIEGRRVQNADLSGSTAVWLGDPETGERLVIVASGEKAPTPIDRVRRLSRSGVTGAAGAVAALAAIAIAVYALTSSGSPSTLDRDQLARGTVRIETSENSLGSGTVLDSEMGLILTNAHVVAPRALGQGVLRDLLATELEQDPRTISIWTSAGLDRTAEPRYLAETVAVDGYLDLAIVRITETIGGSIIEAGDLDDLVAIPLGDSAEVESGDPITIYGHPTVAQSNAATLTTGVVAGPVSDARLRSNQAYINLDADIRPGNSGGLVADSSGRIIGVPTHNWVEDSVEEVGAMRPIGFAIPLLDAARAGDVYTSDYITPLTDNEDIPSVSVGFGATNEFRANCGEALSPLAVGDRSMSLLVDYSGFPSDQHQDLAIGIIEGSTGDFTGFTSTAYEWPFEFEESGCLTAGVGLTRALTAGPYFIQFFAGPNYEFIAEFELVLE